jgi:hypothetical protein
MSKKLIAIASAAALALSALVAAPATAALGTFSVDIETTGKTGTGVSATTGYTINVPSGDVIRATTDSANRSGAKFEGYTQVASASVKVTSTGGLKLLTATQYGLSATNSKTGTGEITVTALTDGSFSFYAYTTSTDAASMTVQELKADGTALNSKTIWVEGLTDAGNAYSVAFTAPATAGIGSEFEVSGTVSDMFGNKIEDAVVTVTGTGGDVEATEQLTWDAVKKVYVEDITARTSAGQFALALSLAETATKVTALGTPATTAFFVVNAADLSAQVTALTAQVAALTAQLASSRPTATSVTKKKYNTLARKWNAANPGARVALKK